MNKKQVWPNFLLEVYVLIELVVVGRRGSVVQEVYFHLTLITGHCRHDKIHLPAD